MKRIGLMGCGMVAGYGHLPALHKSEDWDLVSIFEPDAKRRAEAQEKFEVANAFDDSDAFFASGIDAVAITSPAPCHLQNVRDAARHGKPVLCEKPLAMTDSEVEEMMSVMDAAGVPLYTGFTYRFGEEALRMKGLIDEGAIGDVRSLRLIYIWNCHGRYETDENGERIEQRRREGRMLEGGPLVDCGVHDIDLARWWLGSEIVRYNSAGAWVQDYEAPDHVYVHMDHANGAHTMTELSFTFCHTAKEPFYHLVYDAIGTEGVIRYESAKSAVELRSSSRTETFPVKGHKNFASMYAEFAKALATGERGNLATAEDGLIATRIARGATEQVIAGRDS